MHIKRRVRSPWSSKRCMNPTGRRSLPGPLPPGLPRSPPGSPVRPINPAWLATSRHPSGHEPRLLSKSAQWNRSGSPSRYPYIPTFGGRPGLSFALELPKQPSFRSCRARVQDTTRFSYHMNGHLSKVRLRRDYVTYKRAEYPRHYLFYTFITIELVFLQP